MAIRQRSPDAWTVDVTVAGVRRQSTATDKGTAELAEAMLRVELLQAGASSKNPVWTMDTAYGRCYESVWKGSRGERMVVINANRVLTFFGRETPVTLITTAWVDDFANSLIKGGAANATVNRYLAVLSKLLTFCIQRHSTSGLSIKPYIERRREPGGRVVQVTREDEVRLDTYLRHIGMEDQADAFALMIDTGARVGDMRKVTVEDVNVEGAVVVFRTRKAGNTTGIPLTGRALEVVKRRIAVVKTGKLWPFAYWWFRSAWARVVQHLGKEHDPAYVVHGLRHTTASRLVQAGVNLKVVQEFMGHTEIKTTMRYAHLAPASLNVGRDALEAAVAPT